MTDVIGGVTQLFKRPGHDEHRYPVTVAIPYANAEKTIGAMIESLRGQGNFELLLVSNGTTDDTTNVALQAAEGMWARVVICESVGYDANARNVSVQEARADKVLFLDADDTVSPGYVQVMVERLEMSPVVTADWDYSTLNEWVPEGTIRELPFTASGGWPYAPAGTLGVRKGLWMKIGGFRHDLWYAANNEWCFRANAAGFPVVRAPGALVNYRLRGSAAKHFRQRFVWGQWEVAARKEAERYGLPRKRNDLSRIKRLFWSAKGAKTMHDWYKVAGDAGQAFGHVVGSVRFRKVDL